MDTSTPEKCVLATLSYYFPQELTYHRFLKSTPLASQGKKLKYKPINLITKIVVSLKEPVFLAKKCHLLKTFSTYFQNLAYPYPPIVCILEPSIFYILE